MIQFHSFIVLTANYKTRSYDSVPFSSQCNNNFFLLNHILQLDRIYLESIYKFSCLHINHSKKSSHIYHLSLFYLWNLKVHVPNVQYRFHLSRQSHQFNGVAPLTLNSSLLAINNSLQIKQDLSLFEFLKLLSNYPRYAAGFILILLFIKYFYFINK